MKQKPTPCYFIQTGVGNIVMRLEKMDTGAGTALTLHQIVSANVPVKEIPFFDVEKFKKFYRASLITNEFLIRILEKGQHKCSCSSPEIPSHVSLEKTYVPKIIEALNLAEKIIKDDYHHDDSVFARQNDALRYGNLSAELRNYISAVQRKNP